MRDTHEDYYRRSTCAYGRKLEAWASRNLNRLWPPITSLSDKKHPAKKEVQRAASQ